MSSPRFLLGDPFESVPRFGHSSSFASLYSPDPAVVYDYIIGILVVSLFILSIYACWGLILLIVKLCCGPKRVGFVSGAPFQATLPNGQTNPWILRGRILFGLSTLLFAVFSLTFVTLGVGNMVTTTKSIGQGASVSFCFVYCSVQGSFTYCKCFLSWT